MNRSTMYDYLKNIPELKALFYKHGKGYHIKFVPEIWTQYSQVVINDWHIENFYSITMLIQGLIIEGEVSDMQVHIKYGDIEEFSVYLEEGYKVIKG